MEHAKDIHSRPARTWFQSEREKKAGVYWGCFRGVLGVYWGVLGVYMGRIGVYWGYIRGVLGAYWDVLGVY